MAYGGHDFTEEDLERMGEVGEDWSYGESEDLPAEEAELPNYPWLGLYHGHDIERMISHTLGTWCSHKAKPKIYIVTPFIDRDGLLMIRDAIENQGKIEALYTRDTPESPLGPTMQGILAEENFFKLRVGPREIENQKLYYHCKFVAAEFPDRVEILMTSANFTAQHFMREQIDSVHKYTVAPGVFRKEYLKKLNEHSNDYEWPTTETDSSEDEQEEEQRKRAPYTPTKQGECYNCGEEGHYANECPKEEEEEEQEEEEEEEEQRKRAPYTPTKHVVCYNCGEEGHYANECPNKEEEQRKRARYTPTKQGECYNCGEEGHFAYECPDKEEQPRKRARYTPTTRVVCYNCKERGHYANECPNEDSDDRSLEETDSDEFED